MRLLERRFLAPASVADTWAHLEKVEAWPSWAKHIKRVVPSPPGILTPTSQGTIWLANGLRSTFRMTEFHPGVNWKWAGPFLWLQVHYDHEFKVRGPRESEVVFRVDAEGPLVSVFGPLFAFIYGRSLNRAIPHLVANWSVTRTWGSNCLEAARTARRPERGPRARDPA